MIKFVVFFLFLLGVAGSFADDRAPLNRNRRSASPYPQDGYQPNNPGAYRYQNNGPGYDSGLEFQQIFDQQFRNLWAQQAQLQAQIQRQIQQQQAGHYSWASSMSYITNPEGVSDPNARIYAYSATSPNGVIASSNVDSKLGYGVSKSTVGGNSLLEMNNRLGNGGPYGEGSNYGSSYGPQSASSSISIGPQGGFQAGQVNPASPGILSRFGESLPPPSGNSYGVFSSSSSHQSVGPDGKPTSFKSATTGFNDNGKVSYQTVHDP